METSARRAGWVLTGASLTAPGAGYWARCRRSDRREGFEAFLALLNARDFEALAELSEGKVEFRSLFGGSEGGPAYTGIDGLRRWAEGVDEVWEGWHQEVVEFHDVDDDTAVIVTRATGRAKGSGVPLDNLSGNVLTWRQDGSRLLEAYSDPRDAFAAVELRD